MRIAYCLLSLLPLVSFASVSEGWDNINPERKIMEPGKVLWSADLSLGMDAFSVELHDGAEGSVSIVDDKGGLALKIVKTNSRGYIVVEPKAKLQLNTTTELQAYAYVSGDKNDPEYSYGFLRMYGKTRSYAYFKNLDGRGSGGPMMDNLFNSSQGASYRKLCRFLANKANGLEITPAIAVAGQPSESLWRNWGIEDLKVSKKNWSKFLKKVESPDHTKDMQDEKTFDASLAKDVEHTARVVNEGGVANLAIDGIIVPPVVYKGKIARKGKNNYCGKKMEENGVKVQVITTRFGDSSEVPGFWTSKGYDAKAAAAEIKQAMRMAPNSIFFLTLIMDAYPEFTEENPDEVWIAAEGKPVWGQHVHANYSLDPSTFKTRHWKWVSYHSLVWREAVKKNIAALVEELKSQGLSKRIVGVHLGGYHDHQFATRHPDFSQPAIKAFKEWQKTKLGTVNWRDAPSFVDENFFVPGKDDHQIAYYQFLKEGPFNMLEELAAHVKGCFNKNIVAVRWCMSAFGGTFCSAYDITAFAQSKYIDIIAPQPDYTRRMPGIGIGQRLPSASFHLNNKLFLNEFDLRTYGAVSGGETELRVTGLSQAIDDQMWQSTYRKVAGMMLADRQGWWFYDMAGGWFEPDGIAADIRDSLKSIKKLMAQPRSDWKRSVALVVDEEGAKLRNTVHRNHYYNYDEEKVFGAQLQLLASSGVPYDIVLANDLIKDPSIASSYKTLVFMGMYSIDAARQKLLAKLKSDYRTLVFLAATGIVGGSAATGFEIDYGSKPANNEVVAEKGVEVNVISYTEHSLKAKFLGGSNGGYWTPRRDSVRETSKVKVIGRYASDKTVAIAEAQYKDWKGVFVGSAAGLTPQYFNKLAKESGAYVPAPYGLQVNMNGNFISVHAAIGGHYDFKLPFKCEVINLKTNERVLTKDGILPMNLAPGETRWYKTTGCQLSKKSDIISGTLDFKGK